MGLLDSLFSPDSYGGQGGGLLDFLRNIQQQNQYQPAPGFAGDQPSSMDNAQWPYGPNGAPSAAPPAAFASRFNALPNAPQPVVPLGRQFDSQAQPIAVGDNYQMPRIGNANQFTPPPSAQAMLPPNAQPMPTSTSTDISAQSRGAAPPEQQTIPSFLNNQGGLGAGVRGFVNNLHTGPLGAIIGGIGNAVGMQDPAQQNLRAEYDATRQLLIDSGVPAAKANSTAMLAVMNKDVGKTILPELVTNKVDYKTEKDAFGTEHGYWINKIDQTKTPADAGASAGGSSGDLGAISQKISSMRDNGATPDQLIKQIPQAYQGDVQALVSGKSIPANMGRAQIRSTLITLAHLVDPTFDETLIPARVQMRKDFSGEGKNGQAIGALNTVQHHAGQLSDAIEDFEKAGGGSNWPVLNAGKLMLANNTSYDPKLRDAAQKLSDKLNATEHEVASAYNAGHITDADRKTWNDIKASNLPADQLRRKLADFDELLAGKRDSLNHIYQTMFHEDAPTIDKKANEETSTKIHSRLPGYGSGGKGGNDVTASGIQEGATATNPQTGAKLTYRNGKWQ